MKALAFFLLFMGLTLVLSQTNNPPELKLAFNYEVLDLVKNNLIKPLIEDKLKDVTLSTIFSGKKGPFTGEVLNVSLSNIALDWDNSFLLIPRTDNAPTLVLQNLSLLLTYELGAHFYIFNYSQPNNTVKLNGLNLEIGLGFQNLSDNEASFVYIDYVNTNISACAPKFNNTYMNIVFLLGEIFGFKVENYAGNLLQEVILGLNQTVIDKSLSGVQLGLMELFQVDLSLADLPYVFNVGEQPYQALSLNLEVIDIVTNQSAPVAAADFMPDYYENGLPVQVFVSENAVSQALWAFFQTGYLNRVISNADLPSVIPLYLNASSLNTFFPMLNQGQYYNKGIYLKTNKGQALPIVFIRDGRLVTCVELDLEFYVDMDSSHYPDQGLANCTTCDLTIAFSVAIMGTAVLYQPNVTHFDVHILDTQITNVNVTMGDVSGESLVELVDNLAIGLLLQANVALEDGIPNPFIGKYGIEGTSLTIGTDYLQFGLAFKS